MNVAGKRDQQLRTLWLLAPQTIKLASISVNPLLLFPTSAEGTLLARLVPPSPSLPLLHSQCPLPSDSFSWSQKYYQACPIIKNVAAPSSGCQSPFLWSKLLKEAAHTCSDSLPAGLKCTSKRISDPRVAMSITTLNLLSLIF